MRFGATATGQIQGKHCMYGVRSILSWVLALFLFAMFLMLADAKLFSNPDAPNVVFSTIAERSGEALFEPTGRYLTGLAELLAALLLLLPATRRTGAIIAFCISAGAVAFHLSPFLGQEIPVAPGSDKTDGGQLFYLALALTAASGLLIFTHPRGRI